MRQNIGAHFRGLPNEVRYSLGREKELDPSFTGSVGGFYVFNKLGREGSRFDTVVADFRRDLTPSLVPFSSGVLDVSETLRDPEDGSAARPVSTCKFHLCRPDSSSFSFR